MWTIIHIKPLAIHSFVNENTENKQIKVYR